MLIIYEGSFCSQVAEVYILPKGAKNCNFHGIKMSSIVMVWWTTVILSCIIFNANQVEENHKKFESFKYEKVAD